MKVFTKRVTCLVLALTMAGSMAACKKSGKKTEGLVTAASGVMDALISRNTKKLDKTGEFSENAMVTVSSMKDSEAVSAVMKKASYEVDEESIKESKKSTSVKVAVTLPDYEAALDEADGSMSDFIDAIDEMDKDETTKINLTLKFEGEDDEYKLVNGDDVVNDLYGDKLSSVYAISIKGTVPTDTTPVPTDTTPEPTDTTPEPTTAPSVPEGADPSNEYDVVVYQDDNVIIHFIKVDSEGIHFKVENLNTFEVKLQTDGVAVDGVSATEIIMSDPLAAGTTSDALAKCEIKYNQQIGTFSGVFRIVDFDGNLDSYSAIVDTVVIDAGVTPVAPVATGTPLFADDKVKISFKELNAEGAVFEVENLTAVPIGLNVESVAINGVNVTDLYYYGKDISPHSMGDVLVESDNMDTSVAVGTVSGQFAINPDTEHYEYYPAKYDTTVIDANTAVTPPVVEGTPILDDSYVTVTYKGLSEKGVIVNIENKSDRDLIVQAESLSVNQRGIYDVYLSLHTAPHSVCEVVAKGEVDASAQVGMVGGAFIIADDYDRNVTYMTVLDNIVIDANVAVTVAPEGTLIYEDKMVKVYYKGTTEKGIAFDVENLTEHSITMQANDLFINDEECSGLVMSDDVAPHSISEIRLSCKRTGTDAVAKLTITFRIFTWNNAFESYKADVKDAAVA